MSLLTTSLTALGGMSLAVVVLWWVNRGGHE